MKKFINISLIAGILCLFFGAGIFFVGGAMGGGKVVKKLDFSSMLTTDSKNLEKEYAVLEKTKIDDFDKINVKLNTIDFKIAKSDDKNCYISYNLKKEKGEVTADYEVSDGEFKLLIPSYYGKEDVTFHELTPEDRKSTRLNSSHKVQSRMPSSA